MEGGKSQESVMSRKHKEGSVSRMRESGMLQRSQVYWLHPEDRG